MRTIETGHALITLPMTSFADLDFCLPTHTFFDTSTMRLGRLATHIPVNCPHFVSIPTTPKSCYGLATSNGPRRAYSPAERST
jgi:hypothetical protein